MSGIQESKKKVLKDIIIKLHEDLSVEEAKKRFEEEVGEISSTEIAAIEQSLIDDGMSPEDIKKFCNVHALLFESALKESITTEEHPAHPINLFKLENREIEKHTASLKEVISKKASLKSLKDEAIELLKSLMGVDMHYTRKEQVLFPYLEGIGFMGPSQVMWGKDNEVRDLLKECITKIETLDSEEQWSEFKEKKILLLIEEIDGMIFKEEKILFPAAIEKLASQDWVKILKESEDVGYVFIEQPKEADKLIKELKEAVAEDPVFNEGVVTFPTGNLHLKELLNILNVLTVELTYVDKNDTVKYFSDHKDRIFVRTNSVIGRKVQNCHPPQSVDLVEKIVIAFKAGERDYADFWVNIKGRDIYIKFLAIRDNEDNYMGTLEITQDITEIKKLEGEKRLLDERG